MDRTAMNTTLEMRDQIREGLRDYLAKMPPEAQVLARSQVLWMRERLRASDNVVSFLEGSLSSMFELLIEEKNSSKAVAMTILIYALAMSEEWPNGIPANPAAGTAPA
jgi:hypothetical protein